MGDDVVVIMERMTTTTTTTSTTTKKDEEKETKITVSITKELSSTDDQIIADERKVVNNITEDVETVTKLFLGFSLWCAGYGIVYTVAMIIVLCWNGNKVSVVIVSMIPALLVSCLLLRWAHSYAVKLIDSYLINPGPSELIPENRRREFEENISLRYVCPGLCFFVDGVILGVKGWSKQPKHWEFVMVVLSLSFLFLLFAHYNWIRVYLNKKLIIMRGLPNHHPKEETTNNNNNIDNIINIGSSSM